MKRKTAKENMAESLRELAAGRKIDRITIREITDNCQYSPATFCRRFRDKYDLIAWITRRRLKKDTDVLFRGNAPGVKSAGLR